MRERRGLGGLEGRGEAAADDDDLRFDDGGKDIDEA